MSRPLHAFEAFGVELEYMLVRRDTLDVLPEVDGIFHAASGSYVSDYEDGPITWSNELVRHVMEVKVSEPVASLAGLDREFARSIRRIQALADGRQARLLPTAMHPWMDPSAETRLWPHEYADVYAMFHRIFNCHRHGWANLQSVHLNLPFHGDEEFGRLHAAIRLVLPLLPALAASSPIVESRRTGILDNRLDVYVNNSRLVNEITGEIIPEPVFSEAAYREQILEPMYRAIRPHDPEGVLQDEFLNARGAIARFDRGAIEIRLLDVQECPLADIAIVEAVIHAVRRLYHEIDIPFERQCEWPAARLRGILLRTIQQAELTMIEDTDYLRAWGLPTSAATARDVWAHILGDLRPGSPETSSALECILSRGTLSRRMLAGLPDQPQREHLRALYERLADCLAGNRMLA